MKRSRDEQMFILGSVSTWIFLQIFPISFYNCDLSVFLILINYDFDFMKRLNNKWNLSQGLSQCYGGKSEIYNDGDYQEKICRKGKYITT